MQSSRNKWDQRYSEPGFAYGTDPNDFLAEHVHLLPERGKVLCLADGEGRNSVLLARKGFQVTAVDSSSVGMQKTEQLARDNGVEVETIVADLADFVLEQNHYDAVISIFCHLPIPLRKKVHHSVVKSLKQGGIFLLEGYTPKQLNNNTGGPPVAELLMELKYVREEITPLEILHGVELNREINEGRLHTGVGSVVQLIARKTS